MGQRTVGAIEEENGVRASQNGDQSHIHLENIVVLDLLEYNAVIAISR
jgi:hypothetical protein